MRLETTERFRKSFRRLAKPIQRQVRQCLERFEENPRHPGLHFERVGVPEQQLHTLRVNQGDRVLLFSVVQQEHYLLLDVGSHDTIYRKVQRLP